MDPLIAPLIGRLIAPLCEPDGEGAAPPPPTFSPSLDFSDARNSQYLPIFLEDF